MGPPGTGKTMLARAVAGEAGVPFFYSSGPCCCSATALFVWMERGGPKRYKAKTHLTHAFFSPNWRSCSTFACHAGSEFDEMYVGVGARRVRELFGACACAHALLLGCACVLLLATWLRVHMPCYLAACALFLAAFHSNIPRCQHIHAYTHTLMHIHTHTHMYCTHAPLQRPQRSTRRALCLWTSWMLLAGSATPRTSSTSA